MGRRLLCLAVVLGVVCGCILGTGAKLEAVAGSRTWASYRGDNGNSGSGGYAKQGFPPESGAVGGIHWRGALPAGPTSDLIVSENDEGYVNIRTGITTTLYAIDTFLGRVRWSRTIGEVDTILSPSTPALDEQNVYVSSADGVLYSFRRKDSRQVWMYRPAGLVAGKSNLSSPKVDASRVYVLFQDVLYAVDKGNGQLLWQVKTGPVWTAEAVCIVGDQVYVASTEHVLALHTTDGAVVWKSPTAGMRTPVCDGQHLFLAGNDARLKCLDVSDGRLLWSRRLGFGLSELALWGTRLFATETDGHVGRLYALDMKTGKTEWTFSPVMGDSSPVVDAAGVVYIPVLPKLVAIDAATGKKKWALSLKHWPFTHLSSPTVGPDGTIYISNNEGTLYSVQ